MPKSCRSVQRQRLMATAWVDKEHRDKWEFIEKRLGRAMTPDELKDYVGYVDEKGKFRAPRKDWYAVPPETEYQPKHQHDCEACAFIKNITVGGIEYDVYRCANPVSVTWIARFGDDGPDYWSCDWSILETMGLAGPATPLCLEMQRIAKKWEES